MSDPAGPLRRLLLVLLVVGLVGVAADLLLLAHYEDGWMLIPFGAILLAVTGAAVRLLKPSAPAVHLLRGAMGVLFATSLAGLVLHYRAGLEFQADMDPTLSVWPLFWKVMRMKAPPPLAPGALLQLSLLGLAATYRDPLVARSVTLLPSAGEQT